MNVFTTQLVKTFQDSLQERKKKNIKIDMLQREPFPFFLYFSCYLLMCANNWFF